MRVGGSEGSNRKDGRKKKKVWWTEGVMEVEDGCWWRLKPGYNALGLVGAKRIAQLNT